MTLETRKKLKGATKSKMMWFGFLLVVFGTFWNALPSLQDSIPIEWFPLITAVVGAVVMGLRWITEEGLYEKH